MFSKAIKLKVSCFGFQVPGAREAAIVAVAVVAWVPLVRIFWQRQLIDRFLGVP